MFIVTRTEGVRNVDAYHEISCVQVRETVSDSVLERADEVMLIDVSPDDVLERLRQGKIYVPKQAAFALERFFRKNNLVALRGMALRHAVDRVHDDVEVARLGSASNRPWPTIERLLVCVGPNSPPEWHTIGRSDLLVEGSCESLIEGDE